MTHNEMPKDSVEELLDLIFDTEYIGGKQPNLNREYIREALTIVYNKGVEVERARVKDEFAKVAKYTQDFDEDGYGEAVNTSYYELYEGQWEYIIRPKDTPLPDDKI